MNSRGNSMANGLGSGNSFANSMSIGLGPDTPKWARDPEFQWARAMSTTSWDFME
jgi:hypothetical protein